MTALVDTCVFYAFYSLRDIHHWDAVALLAHMAKGKWGQAFVSNHVLGETLTLLKYRLSPETAEAFLETFVDEGLVRILYVDEDVERKALETFKRNLKRKGFSYVDAVTMVVLEELGIRYLLTFDERSFREVSGKIVGPGYWELLPQSEREELKKLAEKYVRGGE